MSASAEKREHAVERSSRIFAIIKDAAARGDTCPTNATLAERFDCGPSVIARAFTFLETCGMITVERSNSARVATIRATGERTAGVVKSPHWTKREAERPWTDDETDLLADMMAEGMGYGAIADEMGRTKWSVRSRWAKVVKSMGWQAQ